MGKFIIATIDRNITHTQQLQVQNNKLMIRKNKSKQLKLKIKMQIKNKIKPYIELKNMKNKKSTINNEMI